MAAGALNAHKLRSFLTLLGVIIGVMTVVSVVSIISGLNNYINEKVFQLNPDVYIVTQFGIITSRALGCQGASFTMNRLTSTAR